MVKNISISKSLIIFDTNQIHINAYTLILEKDFRIGEREKSISYTKIIYAYVIKQEPLGSP